MPLVLVIAANFLWGVIPIYYYLLGYVDPAILISVQIISTFVTLCLVEILISRTFTGLFSLTQLKISLVPGFIISTNWLIYLLAMLTDNVVDAGMGYFFTPIFAILLARILINEKISASEALGLIVCIVATITYFVTTNLVPAYGLGLALSFSLYALWHKTNSVENSTMALRHETALMLPIALAILIFKLFSGEAYLIFDKFPIMVLIGPITLLPLYLFVRGCPGMHSVTLGLCQYIAPAASLFVAYSVFGEEISTSKLLLAAALSLGVLIMMISSFRLKLIGLHK